MKSVAAMLKPRKQTKNVPGEPQNVTACFGKEGTSPNRKDRYSIHLTTSYGSSSRSLSSVCELSSCIFRSAPVISWTSSQTSKTYVDRCALLSRHRYTIAGPCIYLADLLLLRFVLSAEDKSRKIGAPLEIVDDHPFDLCSQRSQDDR